MLYFKQMSEMRQWHMHVIIMDWVELGHKVGGLDWVGFRKLDPCPTLDCSRTLSYNKGRL